MALTREQMAAPAARELPVVVDGPVGLLLWELVHGIAVDGVCAVTTGAG